MRETSRQNSQVANGRCFCLASRDDGGAEMLRTGRSVVDEPPGSEEPRGRLCSHLSNLRWLMINSSNSHPALCRYIATSSLSSTVRKSGRSKRRKASFMRACRNTVAYWRVTYHSISAFCLPHPQNCVDKGLRPNRRCVEMPWSDNSATTKIKKYTQCGDDSADKGRSNT